MAIHTLLDAHLQRIVGNAGFTVSGATATLPTTSVDHRRLSELLDVAAQLKHDVTLAAGVLTVKPR